MNEQDGQQMEAQEAIHEQQDMPADEVVDAQELLEKHRALAR